jgi:hypothetical protein
VSAIAPSFVATLVCGLIAFCATDSRAQCRFADAPSNATWTYRFRAEAGTDGLGLHVTAQFPLGPTGILSVQLPAHWAGETLHAMTNLRSGSADVRLEVDPDGVSGVLRGEPNRLATVTYDLKKDWTGPLVHPRQFHPVLMPEYFEITSTRSIRHCADSRRRAMRTYGAGWLRCGSMPRSDWNLTISTRWMT